MQLQVIVSFFFAYLAAVQAAPITPPTVPAGIVEVPTLPAPAAGALRFASDRVPTAPVDEAANTAHDISTPVDVAGLSNTGLTKRLLGDLQPATGLLGPATGLLGPATGLLGPATGLLAPATGVVGGATGSLPGLGNTGLTKRQVEDVNVNGIPAAEALGIASHLAGGLPIPNTGLAKRQLGAVTGNGLPIGTVLGVATESLGNTGLTKRQVEDVNVNGIPVAKALGTGSHLASELPVPNTGLTKRQLEHVNLTGLPLSKALGSASNTGLTKRQVEHLNINGLPAGGVVDTASGLVGGTGLGKRSLEALDLAAAHDLPLHAADGVSKPKVDTPTVVPAVPIQGRQLSGDLLSGLPIVGDLLGGVGQTGIPSDFVGRIGAL